MNLKNKLFDILIVIFVIIIAIGVFVVSNVITNTKIEAVKQEKYNIYSKNIKEEISLLIKNKQNFTLAIALSLAQDTNIKKALKQKKPELIDLKQFSLDLKEKIKLQNTWFHIVDKTGTSFYRSWVKKRGDNLTKIRMDIAKVIKEPQVINTISTGKFNMTFKSIIPIYDNGEFLGIFEIITHFDSIFEHLKQHSIESILIVDKKYKKQLTKAITKTFVGDYYIANFNVKKQYLKYIKNNGVQNYIHFLDNYKIDEKNNYFIVFYNILDIKNDPMGTIIAFKKLDSLNMDDINHMKSNMVFYIVLSVLLLFLIGYFIISRKYSFELDAKVKKRTNELNKEKNYIQTILDTNPSIIIVTKNSHIISANKKFLEFFKYSSIEEFTKYYDCICEFFKTLDNEIFPDDKMINGEVWSDYLAKSKKLEHFVQLEFENEIYEFAITASYLKNNEDILLTFQNITELKNKEKLLYEQSKMASMGEMIGNIAHQWRQPLSIISTAATGMKLQKKFNNLEDEYFDEACDLIDNNAQYLSKTIDDFKSFIKGNRKKELFYFNDEIDKLFHLIKPSIKAHNINIVLNVKKNVKINGYANELIQCLINIYNNSKDVLMGKKESERFIFIDVKTKNKKVYIDIKDSGGGIEEKNLSKIFDPYFTTKHQSLGTGLGLHMTYNLIVDGMGGTIDVQNSKFEYNNKTYKGALFEIVLPLN